jgi:sortase B
LSTNNNTYYLEHTFDKTYNKAGWIFLDYRNNIKHIDKNTILYALSDANKIMFEPFKNTLDKKWLTNHDNHLIKISTEYENTLWKIVSIYHIKNTNDYLKITFNTNDDFINYSDMILNRSIHNFKTPITIDDKLLTISTSYNDDEELVLHAKLIKYEKK